ncbi:MAG TPA: BlaI/MecI/CopY family transcriptional regulator [Chthonomonadaceae bacterium]|nr:BlaI/MecI/CopY family transcriptional regulator [Chthonomonadaceae bacterium]
MRKQIHALGELQMAVLNVLWGQHPATVSEVLASLPLDRKPAYTTVLTVLRNLEKRGLVRHESAEGARMFRYRPLVTAQDVRNGILQDVLARLFAGSPAVLIKHLLETEGFSLAELQDIQRALTQRQRAITGPAASLTD